MPPQDSKPPVSSRPPPREPGGAIAREDEDEDEDDSAPRPVGPQGLKTKKHHLVVVRAFGTLWSMLDLRGRLQFCGLVLLQIATALAGMGGMIAIFAFIKGLSEKADGGRSGAIARAVQLILHERIVSQVHYAVVGGLLVLGFMAAKNALALATEFLMNRFLMKRNLSLSRELLDGYLRAPFEQLQAGRRQQAQRQVDKVFRIYSKNFAAAAQFLADGLTVLAVGVLLMWVSPILTISALLTFGLAGATTYWVMQRTLVQMGRDESQAQERAARHLEHAFAGIVEVRLRDLRAEFVARYMQATERTAVLTRRKAALTRIPGTTNELLLTTMITGAVLYLTLTDHSVADALPTLALFGFAGLRMNGAITRLNTNLQKMRREAEKVDELADVLSRVSERFAAPEGPAIGRYLAQERKLPSGADGRMHQELRLEDVRFYYPGMQYHILKRVTLTIKKGEFIGICGPSGGGKSTLVQIIMGLLAPVGGTVQCDDWNIHHHIRAWHHNIGYVSQNVFLTDQSVWENVAFGVAMSKIDRDRVLDALEMAAALGFCEELPEGLDTNLKSGSILSGGQSQRIAIARALYTDPEIIIFDEATAALDNTTEREISDAIARLSGRKTVICVAHRLSTIRHADRIYFVRKGRVAASGSFDELLARSPEFRDMVVAGSTTREAEESA